jgi:hypothetical protein
MMTKKINKIKTKTNKNKEENKFLLTKLGSYGARSAKQKQTTKQI